MIEIKTIGKKKQGNGNTTKSYGGGFASTVTISKEEINGVNIWGQYHDHNGDVDGDLTANGNITASGTITAAQGQINGDVVINGDCNINGEVSAANADISGNINGDDLFLGGDAHCCDLDCANVYATNSITTDFLTVTKAAHFFNLTIDEIKSVGGQIILSAANATIDYVTTTNGQYLLAWKYEDGEKGIRNQFRVNDQIICQTFNESTTNGTSYSNKYYWAVVTMVGDGTYTIDGESVDCHYIVLSNEQSGFDGQDEPAAGDKICQLGYRGTDDPARQSAIILSAYQSLDNSVTAPSIVQYEGINTFNLDGCKTNQMAHNENIFTGNFQVVSNGTVTNVVDLINGQNPQVMTDSQQAWMMADSSGKTYAMTDYQNLPTTIQAYLGSTLIPYSEWITGSQIKFKNKTYRLTGTAPAIQTLNGLTISSIVRNTNDCTINWGYTANTSTVVNTQTNETETVNNGTTETNQTLEITIKFTHSGTTYTVTKNVPFNLIKASEVTQGADAEFDKLMVDKFDLTVTLDNKLTCNVNAKVYHIKGNSIEQVTDLTNYTCQLALSNNTTYQLSKSTYFYKTTNISSNYTSLTNPPTSATLKLMKNGTLMDEFATAIKFNAGSIFTITDNAITSAVQQANTYTDGEITTVNADISTLTQTANSISSRVTAIEGDYVTSSELTQTADNIQLNVYDELLNRTGIDISNGQITLNGNTLVNGNLSLTDDNTGFSLIGNGGITQLMPQSIGTYSSFTARASTIIHKTNQTTGAEKDENDNYIIYNFDNSFIIGTITSGHTITIAPVSRDYFIMDDNGNYTAISSSNYSENSHTITVYEDGVEMASGQFQNGFNYTSQGGNITIITVDRVSISKTLIYQSSPRPYQELVVPIQQNHITVTVPNDAFMLIGYDGLAVNFGTSATAYIGAESTTIKYGNYGVKVSSSGLQQWNGSNWVGINNRRKVTTMTANYTLTNDDDLILYNSSTQRTLTLPSTLEVGKTVYIKKLGSTTLKIQSSSTNIYLPTATSGVNNTTLTNYICLTWDGSRWLVGYLYN